MEFFLVSTFHFLRVIMINRRYVYINISVWNLYFEICGCQILFLNYRNFRIFNLEGHDDKNLLV